MMSECVCVHKQPNNNNIIIIIIQDQTRNPNQTRGASHCGLAIYIKKYIKAKEEL
jgi:hypothetical protein